MKPAPSRPALLLEHNIQTFRHVFSRQHVDKLLVQLHMVVVAPICCAFSDRNFGIQSCVAEARNAAALQHVEQCKGTLGRRNPASHQWLQLQQRKGQRANPGR
jgi:hypothetical protein